MGKDDISVVGYQVNYSMLDEKFKKGNEGLYYFLLAVGIYDEFKDKGMGVKKINKTIRKGTKVTYQNLCFKPRKQLDNVRKNFEIMIELFQKSFELGTIKEIPLSKNAIDVAVKAWEKNIIPLLEEKIEEKKED